MACQVKNKFSQLPLEVRASIAYTICSVIQRGVMIATLPIFTRLMSPEQYGEVSVYTSWFAFFSILLSLNLPYGSFQTAMVKYADKRKEYVATICGIFFFLSVLFLLLYVPFYESWDALFSMPTVLVVAMVVEVFATSCIQAWMGLNRFLFEYKSVFVVTVAMAIASQFVAVVFVLLFSEKGIAKVIGSAGVVAIFGIVVAIRNIIKGDGILHKGMWKYALGFNIPLIVYYLSQVVFNQSDILMINYFCGKEDAAIYNVAYSLAMLLTFVITAVQGSYTPWFYNKLVKHEERLDRNVSLGLSLALACCLLLIVLAAPEIVFIMAGEAYAEAIWIVPPVAACVLLLFYACLLDRFFFYYECKLYLTIGAILSALINIVLNYLLIPRFGFIIAGYTTLLSYVTLVAVDIVFVRKLAKSGKIDLGIYNAKGLILLLLAFVLLSAAAMSLYPYAFIRYGVFAFLIVAMFVFRGRILGIVNRIRNS